MPTALDLLKQLITCKSITPNSNGALECLQAALEKLGFTTEIVTFPKGEHKTKEQDKVNYSVQNLVAKYGQGEPVLAFCGHLDVVPPGELDSWHTKPFEPTIKSIDGEDFLFGRGAEDMKGGVAAFYGATKDFIAEHKFKGTIVFLITMDEEDVAINGVKALMEYVTQSMKINDCLVGEASSVGVLGDYIKIGSRGSLELNLKVTGKQGHVAYPENTVNPVNIMAQLIVDLKATVLDNGNENFPPSNLEIVSIDTGNKTYNIIPESCKAIGNIRYNTNHTVESLQNIIKEVVNKYPQATVSFNQYPSLPYCASIEDKIYKCVAKSIVETVEITPKEDTRGGTSDARYILPYCPVLEFGLKKRTLHQCNENISLNDFNRLEAIYKRVLQNYFIYS